MKKFFVSFLLFVMVVSCISAAGNVERDNAADGPFIGLTIFDYTNTFVGYIRNGVNFYMDEQYPDLDFMIVNGESNQATQTERIDTMINKGVDVLAVNPVDSSAGETIVGKAKKANIPIVFFNRMPTLEVLNSYDKCWYVGLDALYQGTLEGEMVGDAWKKILLNLIQMEMGCCNTSS